MNLFISWSGEESKAYAEAFRRWLPNVIQSLKPFYSPEDIKAGKRWSAEIAQRLQSTELGIICMTRDNATAPWLMYEAGALSKQLESRVCPVLFGLKPTDIEGPLTQFQLNVFCPEGIYNVLVSINDHMKPMSLDVETLRDAFTKWWPEIEARINEARPQNSSPSIKSSRTERDLIEEILIRIRNSTVEQPINTDMIQMLINSYGRLADAARFIADAEKKQIASHALYHFQFPTQDFITKVSDTDKRRQLAEAYSDAVSIFYQDQGKVDKVQLVKNLLNPSHGLIVTAPIISKGSP